MEKFQNKTILLKLKYKLILKTSAVINDNNDKAFSLDIISRTFINQKLFFAPPVTNRNYNFAKPNHRFYGAAHIKLAILSHLIKCCS